MATCSTVYQIPGPKGDTGTDGTDGTDGVNAYTTTAADFDMPAAIDADLTITLTDASWVTTGQMIFIQGAGYLVAEAKSGNTIDISNPEYSGNTAATTTIPSGKEVGPSGLIGPDGALSGAAGGDLGGTYPDPTLEITTTKGDVILRDASANARLAVGADGTRLKCDSAAGTGHSYAKVDLADTTQVTGATGIAQGGTGQAAKLGAFDALSPVTTKGDIIVRDASNNIRLAVGSDDEVLVADAAEASGTKWAVAPTAPITVGSTSSSPYSLSDSNDLLLVDCTGGAITVDLHAVATAKQKVYYIKKIDGTANAVTVDGNAAETIDGAATQAIAAQYSTLAIVPDGTDWHIV